jgi:bifunctional non-homologous end joining protein LigD
MSLKQYRKKRHFGRTAEPKGAARNAAGHRFVIQKHAASHLHYDFRLELDGTLKSWAVPKGPSLDPAQKRLAVQVEDHPLEYADFEGTIPAGEYGGGTVMVWDHGTWTPEVDPEVGYRTGRLKFTLDGQKLKGSWALVRTALHGGRTPQWLLIKHNDDYAKPLTKGDILDKLPKSAATGRTMDEITEGAPAHHNGKRKSVWHSNRARRTALSSSPSAVRPDEPPALRRRSSKSASNSAGKTAGVKPAARQAHGAKGESSSGNGYARSKKRNRDLAKVDGAKRRPMSKKPQAELATLVPEPPKGNEWLHEIKFDGYRMLCCLEKGKVRFLSRSGQDWTARFAALTQAAAALPVEQAILDGEVVVLDAQGVSQFQLLQNALSTQKNGHDATVYYAFDLIYLDGYDLSGVPLDTRKSLLQALLEGARLSSRIRLSEHVVGTGDEFRHQACHAQLEGIISKRRNSLYRPGRGNDWLKCKCRQIGEFVIGGYTRPEGSRIGFGALLLGYFRPDKKFVYAGRVGTGFGTQLLRDLTRRLKALEQEKCPFVETPPGVRASGVRWVRPELVGQIEFSNWTDAGILRQAAFQGLREDKPAREVGRERPAKVPK